MLLALCYWSGYTDLVTEDQARTLAAQRRIVNTTCVGCGVTIRGTIRRRYCGKACLMRVRRRSVSGTTKTAARRI